MRLLRRLAAYTKVLGKASRNKNDFTRYLFRRPAIALAVGTYETAVLLSNRFDTRAKYLATTLTSSLIGCPF
jgi:hypothetical protein